MLARKQTAVFLRMLLMASATCPGQSTTAKDSGESLTEEEILAKAEGIHRRAITLDTHVDVAGAHYATEKLDPGIDNPKLRCDLVKMETGAVDGVFLAVCVEQGNRDAEGYQRAWGSVIARIEAIHRLTKTMYPDRCELATSPDGVQRIVRAGRRAIMIGVENGYPIGTDLSNVERLFRLGARYMTLCHDGHNQIGDSCNPRAKLGNKKAEHNGLSEFGKQVVAEMNRLGMMADVSHIARKSFYDLMETSKAPVIASHSGCRALNDHSRNLDDEQLKALAKNGGVIQMVALGGFLKRISPQRRRAIRELAERTGVPMGRGGARLEDATDEQRTQYREGIQEVDKRYPPANLKDYVDHIDHAVSVAGIDHVGIGSDFDGGAGIPGFNNHSEALNVTVELVRRGYCEEEIRKIWGGNLLRVWRDVEKVAAGLQSCGTPGQ